MPLSPVSLHSLEHHHPTLYLQLKHIRLAQFSIWSRLRKQAALTSIQSDIRRRSLLMSRLFNATQTMLLPIMARDSRLATLIDMGKPLLLMNKLFSLILALKMPISIGLMCSTSSDATQRPSLTASELFNLALITLLSTISKASYSAILIAMVRLLSLVISPFDLIRRTPSHIISRGISSLTLGVSAKPWLALSKPFD